MAVRLVQLVASCVVLGAGVALLLRATLGSDGYSTLINGLSLALDVPFLLVNCVLGVVLVVLARLRGVALGPGTIGQPLVVGVTVSLVMAGVPEAGALPVRVLLLAIGFAVVAIGVAGYLGSNTGAGPTEAAALAFDPPVPFRWSYSVVQGGGALGGWLLGADVGPGTLLVIVGLGPVVDLIARVVPAVGRPAPRERL